MRSASPPPILLLQILPLILNSKTLYILGAGTSAKYIRPIYNLYEVAKKKIFEWGISPILMPMENIRLHESEKHRFRIQGSKHIIHETLDGRLLINETNMDFRDVVLHSKPEILSLVCALTYSIGDLPRCCPEYQIFNLANITSVIANMNHDCLADNFIKRKIKNIHLHGSIDSATRNIIQEHAAHILDYDIIHFYLRNIILSTKENEHILKRNEYKHFKVELDTNNFKYLLIIGYSFFKKNDNDIYDIVTYDLIREYLSNNNCEIIIIDINTDYVADMLSKTIGNLKITTFKINWSCFVHAFVLTNKLKKYSLQKYSAIDINRFVKFYYYLEQSDLNDDFFMVTPSFGKACDL